ncbi:mitochondrial FAD-linked sulfhydryl oxidase [Nematocida sp. AWRm80]|nr:mitochondrial FAD-linked sulfhydryl oxidase [Nematocida sp. AWRm80]
MRKDIAIKSTIGVLVGIWCLLTVYKIVRRRGAKTIPESNPSYYSKPPTKEAIRQELGRSTWTLLHTIAAKYPAYPTREQQSNAILLIDLLTKMFPCEECRGHFKQLTDGFPPQVSSQEEFSQWMCQAHNIVNKRLNKPVFDCARLDDRWDCGCK